MKFHELLKEARTQANLMQKDLAEKFNLVPAYISRLEKGFSLPSDDLLVRICRELNLPWETTYLQVQKEKATHEEVRELLDQLQKTVRFIEEKRSAGKQAVTTQIIRVPVLNKPGESLLFELLPDGSPPCSLPTLWESRTQKSENCTMNTRANKDDMMVTAIRLGKMTEDEALDECWKYRRETLHAIQGALVDQMKELEEQATTSPIGYEWDAIEQWDNLYFLIENHIRARYSTCDNPDALVEEAG